MHVLTDVHVDGEVLPVAFGCSKAELTALVAGAAKKGRSDERSMWISWEHGEVITTDLAAAVRVRVTAGVTGASDVCVYAKEVKAVLAKARAKDEIVIGPIDGGVLLVALEVGGADVTLDEVPYAIRPDSLVRLTAVPDLSLSHADVRAVFTDDATPGDARVYRWSTGFAELLHRVAKAAGKGPAVTAHPPHDGGPFMVTVESDTVDAGTRWDVLISQERAFTAVQDA